MKVDNKQSEIYTPPKNRLIFGGIIFISGFLSPLLIPVVLATNFSAGLKSVLSGLLAVGIPELFMLIAVGVLGKEGFAYLKLKLFGFIKQYGPPDEVGKIRYSIGLVLFLSPLMIAFVTPYVFNHVSFIADNYVAISMVSDALLVIGLFVLGGNFWDKLRGLFLRNAKIQF